MELIIIALIAVEVVIVRTALAPVLSCSGTNDPQCLIRDGPELWEMVSGKKEEESQSPETQ